MSQRASWSATGPHEPVTVPELSSGDVRFADLLTVELTSPYSGSPAPEQFLKQTRARSWPRAEFQVPKMARYNRLTKVNSRLVTAERARRLSDLPLKAIGRWLVGLLALGLVAVLAVRGVRIIVADPSLWRGIAQISGLIALGLLAVSAVGGVALPSAVAKRFSRSQMSKVHAYVGVLGVVFTAVHLASVFATKELAIGWVQLVVPFTREAGRVAQACGVAAVYLMLAVVITSALRRKLSWRWWRRVHLLAFPLFAFALAHTVLAEYWNEPGLIPMGLTTAILLGCLLQFRRRTGLQPVGTVALRSKPPAPAPKSGGGDVTMMFAAPMLVPAPPPMVETCTLSLLISQITWEADGIMSLCLTSPCGGQIPEWEPGAHIDVALPSGGIRCYSLYGDPSDRYCYRIAVLRQDTGRGGSGELHEKIRIGTQLPVGPPRNAFRLEPAPSYLLLAGGIGITALLPMARAIDRQGASWRLIYAGRSRPKMAFIRQAMAMGGYQRVDIVAQDEVGRPDLATLIAGQAAGTAVYCCGPNSMVEDVQKLVEARTDLTLHTELFAPPQPQLDPAQVDAPPLTVQLRRSGTSVEAAPTETLLDAVSRVAPQIAGGCGQGICGRCKVTVVDGVPDHRDRFLTEAERDSGQMLLCVSRALGEKLTLDL